MAVVCVALLSAVWNDELDLMNYQLGALYTSVVCTAALLFGAFVSIPLLYIPAVYMMRIVMISVMLLNTFMIVELANSVDTFVLESMLRSKTSTVIYLNRNFVILSRCFKLSIQAWICLLVFGCLQLITKDYHRLRSNSKNGLWLGDQFERAVTTKFRRLTRPRPSKAHNCASDEFAMDGNTVVMREDLEANRQQQKEDNVTIPQIEEHIPIVPENHQNGEHSEHQQKEEVVETNPQHYDYPQSHNSY